MPTQDRGSWTLKLPNAALNVKTAIMRTEELSMIPGDRAQDPSRLSDRGHSPGDDGWAAGAVQEGR